MIPKPRTSTGIRVGQGLDIHQFASGRRLILGGVHIPYDRGLDGHSDADVLIHSLMDALLGAAGLPDIGNFFPPSEMQWKDASSIRLLELVMEQIRSLGFEVVNCDCSLLLEAPKISSYIPAMKEALAVAIGITADCVGIKVTTAERLGFVGREEGVIASTVVLLERVPS